MATEIAVAAVERQKTAPAVVAAAVVVAVVAAAVAGPVVFGAAAVWGIADAVWETVLRSELDSQPNLLGKVVW